MEEMNYKSNYPAEVTYTSDKNFVVRLKAMIEIRMKEAGYSVYEDKFKTFVDSMDDSEKYLFATKFKTTKQ